MFRQWEYLHLLGRQKAFIIVFCLSAIATSLALTYVFSEKYDAATTIFYRPHEVTRLKAQDTQAFGSPVPAPPFKVIGRTLEEIVKSELILREVVVNLRLDVPEAAVYEGPWYIKYYDMAKDLTKEYMDQAWMIMQYGRLITEDPTVAAVQRLRANIKVVSEESYVFFLIVRDKVPERAAAIVTELTDATRAWLLRTESDPAGQRREQLQILLDDKEREIEGYQRAMEAVLDEHDIVSVQQEIDRGMERLSGYEVTRVQLESQIREKQTELASIEEKLELKKTTSRNSDSARIQPEDFRRLASDKVFTEVELAGLQAKLKSIRGSIATLDGRLQELPITQARLGRLQSAYETANRDYVLLNDTMQEAVVRETDVLTEITILHEPNVPTAPVTPIKIYHVGLAAGLSLAFAIGLVYVLSYFNIRIFFSSRGVKGRRKIPTVPQWARGGGYLGGKGEAQAGE